MNDIEELFKEIEKYADLSSEDAIESDEFSNGYGAFGTTLTNPIPCNTIMGSMTYLASLRTSNGSRVRSERIGSYNSPITSNPVDGYRLFNIEGAEFEKLYISPYAKRNSNKVPDGFKLASNDLV